MFITVAEFPEYGIGEDGEVWTRRPTNGKGVAKSTWRKMLPTLTSHGYLEVRMYCNGRRSRRKVHHLVLEAFCGPCPPGYEARHLDGCKTNNHRENLVWGTRSENAFDRSRHGILVGSGNGNAKLVETEVAAMRADRISGMSWRKLAAKYQASMRNVRDICQGIGWSHV
jgi:hypothetical protein